MNIFLVGYRGTGKTTVAPLLAERLGPPWSAVDLDEMLEATADRSIADIFRFDGEPGFRDLEAKTLAESARSDHQVIATGGGVVLRPVNQAILLEGFVAWLTASPTVLQQRLQVDPKTQERRPSLTDLSPLDEIKAVLAQREPIYRSLAHLTINTDVHAPSRAAALIADAYQLWSPDS